MYAVKNQDDASRLATRLANLRPKIPYDWETLDSIGVEELEKKIVEYQAYLVDNQHKEKLDEELEEAKERVKTLAGPYREAKKRLANLLEYCSLSLEQKGK